MFKRSMSGAAYMLLCALAFYPAAARADSIPTITITSTAGSASWGNGGIGAFLYSPSFDLSFGTFAPVGYFQASPGDSFVDIGFSLMEVIGAPAFPTGELTLGGVDYPVAFGPGTGGVEVSQEGSFIVPSGGTVQIPAVLTGGGTACVNISPGYGCNTVNGVFYPVLVANVDFDIQGFTPAPEPGTALILFLALAMIAAYRYRKPAVTERSGDRLN
jgi:hypothetical protein